jgi:hypothetical protein
MPSSGALSVEVDNPLGAVPPSVAFYSGACGNFKEIECLSNIKSRTLYFPSLAGETLFLRVFPLNNLDGGPFSLCVYDPGCIPEAVDAGEMSMCKNESFQFGAQTITEAGDYTALFQTRAGCDSLVSLSVVVTEVNTEVVPQGAVLTADAIGASYQWLDCLTGNLPVPGATGQTFTAGASGEFAVTISQNGCMDTSACYEVGVVVGIADESLKDPILFSNPVDEAVRLDLHRSYESISIELVNMMGQTMTIQHFNEASVLELDLHAIPSGTYLLRLLTDHDISTLRLLKN